jgi:hypothetical protein
VVILVSISRPISQIFAKRDTAPPTYAYNYQGFSPRELPADTRHAAGATRYSEVSAQTATHRFSELPAGATEPGELESPDISPRSLQTEFRSDMAKRLPQGLGSKGAGQDVKR